jgi:hypothetical protein
MNYEQLEDDIKDKLRADLPNTFNVIVMEDTELEAKRPRVKAEVAVAYYQSDYDKSKSTSLVHQDETLQLSLFFTCRTRRGETGIYALYELVRNSLLGWTPPQCMNPIQLKMMQFQNNVDGWFIYQLSIETDGVVVQEHIEESAPLSTEITFEQPTRLD